MTYWVIESLVNGHTKYASRISIPMDGTRHELSFRHEIKEAIRFADEVSACKIAQGLGFDYYRATEHKDV